MICQRSRLEGKKDFRDALLIAFLSAQLEESRQRWRRRQNAHHDASGQADSTTD